MTTTLEREPDAEPASRLAELLACEQELEAAMASVREDARRRVEAARAEQARGAAELEELLEREAERVRRDVDEAARARVRSLLAEADQRVARFDRVSDPEIERLAAVALRQLMDTEEHP